MSRAYRDSRSSLSYANIAAGAGNFARSASETPTEQTTTNTVTYGEAPYISPRHATMERPHSVGDTEVDSWPDTSVNNNNDTTERDTVSLFHDDRPFFVPSYLTSSRYIQRLKQEMDEQAEARREARKAMLSGSMGNASSTSLHRIRPTSSHMHRGVAQNVVERYPTWYSDDGKPKPLPTAWSEDDRHKGTGVEVVGNEDLELRYTAVTKKMGDEAGLIRADHSIPKQLGLYYYEVQILARGKDSCIGIGLSTPKVPCTRLVGWEVGSYGYHSDEGEIFNGNSNGRPYGPRFTTHDTVGCGINFKDKTIFFTKNGSYLGTAFVDVDTNNILVPTVALRRPNEHVRANFGGSPFVFDIDGMMMMETQQVLSRIAKQDVSKLHPPDDADALIQNLVTQYLAHEGFVDTSRALQQDMRERRRYAPSTAGQDDMDTSEDDTHAINRQRIRQAILCGDIKRALEYTQTHFPQVLQQDRNREVYFKLRCRRFIEMMRRHSEMAAAANPIVEIVQHEEDEQDTQMELDEQIQRETSKSSDGGDHDNNQEDVDMDTELVSSTASLKQDLVGAAIEYGQGLRAEFDDERPEFKRELEQMFPLIAYSDPLASPLGYLLDGDGRASIAEELNGAILVSLGKPSSAALEKMCSQTGSLLDDTAARTGGAAAFINLREDLLGL